MTPVAIPGDGPALRRAILNLVDNGVKYTPAGGKVALSLDVDDGHACLQVRDTGVGIEPADVERIFQAFVRLEPARTRDTEGAGLGLAIARSIVLAHGGSLTVESTPGAGSTFTISSSSHRRAVGSFTSRRERIMRRPVMVGTAIPLLTLGVVACSRGDAGGLRAPGRLPHGAADRFESHRAREPADGRGNGPARSESGHPMERQLGKNATRLLRDGSVCHEIVSPGLKAADRGEDSTPAREGVRQEPDDGEPALLAAAPGPSFCW